MATTIFTEARYGLSFGYAAGDSGWGATFNATVKLIGALMNCVLLSDTIATPPGSPASGDCYFVAANPTGAWAGQAGKIAAFQAGAWTFYTPVSGLRAFITSRGGFYYYVASTTSFAVEVAASGGGSGGAIVLPTSDPNVYSALWNNNGTPTISSKSATGHRYWRINIMSNVYGSYACMAEVSMATTVGGTNLCTSGASAYSSTADTSSGYPASNAVDGNTATYWNGVQSLPVRWQYDFGASTSPAIKEVKITARGDNPTTTPGTFNIETSDDNVTWTVQKSFTAAAWTATGGVGSTQTFTL